MQFNFFVDFATFNAIGLLAGFDFMLVFSIATFLAMLTRYGTVFSLTKLLAPYSKRKGDRSGLPAFRDRHDDDRRH